MRFYSGILLVVVIAAIATPSNGSFTSNFTTSLNLFGNGASIVTRVKNATSGLKSDLRFVGTEVAKGLREAAQAKRLAITNSLRQLMSNIAERKRGLFMSSRTRAAGDVSDVFGPFMTLLNSILEALGVTSTNVTSGNPEPAGNAGDKEVTTTGASVDVPTIDTATPNPKTIENHQRDNLIVLLPTRSSEKSPSTPVNILAYKSQRSASPSTAAINPSS